MRRAVVTVVLVLILGGLLQGCGGSTGGRAPAAESNLIVDNGENHSMTIFIDGSRFVTVDADSGGTFYVLPGTRRVEVRYGNDLNPVQDRGLIDFPDTSTPGFTPVRLS